MAYNLETGKYYISDTDVAASGTGPDYYGYTTPYNSWYIQKETFNGTQKNYTYARGSANYATNWTNRASLSYTAVTTSFA